MKYFNKVSHKINFIYIIIFLFTLIVIDSSIIYGVNNFLLNQIKLKINTKAIELINEFTKKANNYNTQEELKNEYKKIITNSTTNANNMIINVYDNNGKDFIMNKDFAKYLNDNLIDEDTNKVISINTENTIFFLKTFNMKNNKLESWYIQIIYDSKMEKEFIGILKIMILLSTTFGILISSFIGMFSINKFLKPIFKATNFLKNMKSNVLNERIEIKETNDEFYVLIKALNGMIDRMENSFIQQSKFVSDASHELRTPISVIKGYINLLDRWGKNDPKILQESIDHIKEEISNMANLIEKLLFLARGESENLKINNENFYLNDLIDEIIEETKIITDKIVKKEENEIIEINADKKFFKQMIRAMVDNSIKYTNNDGEIILKFYTENDKTIIKVIDNGIGISVEDIPYLFNRFYRADETRSKDTGGSGLGLAIVKWIVEIYSGKIFVESEIGKGSCFTIEFQKKI